MSDGWGRVTWSWDLARACEKDASPLATAIASTVDTIPLLMLEDDLAEAVYGPAGLELTLPGRVAEKILDALERPDHYRGIVEDVRRHLLTHHSYRRRVEELVAALSR